MDFRVLGPVEVFDEGGNELDLGPRKQRALLCFLLLHANEVVSTDRIVQALWGDDAVDKERALWVVVSRLRSALEPGRPRGHESTLLETREQGYVLTVDGDGHRVDVDEFTRSVAEARDLLARDTPADAERAADLLAEALGLWRGDPLGEFRGEEFARHDVTRLEDLQLEARELRAEADLRRGKGREQIAELEALHEQNPLQERFVELLMRALYGAGRQAEALRVLTRYRKRIGEELGIEPSPQLRRLEEQILLHDAAVQGPGPEPGADPEAAGAAVAPANPYKGLRPFLEADASDFHGRDRLVAELVDALRADHTLLAVVGPSGSGKSSVVRAGLVPALRAGAIDGSDGWLIAQMSPGAHPFAELDGALARAGVDVRTNGDDLLRTLLTVLPAETATVLLVIDQFEELFTVTDESTRDRFVEALVTALDDVRGRIRVVVTLRADFYDRPLSYPELGTRLSGNVVNVTPLSTDELHAAAVEPATAAGVRFEPAALASLIADVGQQPGALPLFQYALTELFDRRDGEVLTAAAYADMGGVEGALGRRAEDLYQALTADQAAATREVLLRLVVLDETGTRTRRRVAASELTSLDTDVVNLRTVIEQFGRHRLLAFDKHPETGAPTVEIAHEALLESWSTLAGWIDESVEDLQRLATLRRLIDDWDTAGENPDYLVAGTRLTELETWSERTSVPLTFDEQSYLRAAIHRRDTDLRLEAERAGHEARRLRIALAATAVALVLAMLAGSFAVIQQRRADDRAKDADRQAALATARATAARANALVGSDRPLALALAAEAHSVGPLTLDAVEALITTRQRMASSEWAPLGSPWQSSWSVADIVAGPRSTDIALIGGGVSRSTSSDSAEQELPDADGPDTPILRDGAWVIDGWSGEVIDFFEGVRGFSLVLADGFAFISATSGLISRSESLPDGTVGKVWMRGHRAPVAEMALSPDQTLLASGDIGGTTILWDASTGEQVGDPIVREEEAATALAFSNDGSTLAIGGRGAGGAAPGNTAAARARALSGHDAGYLLLVDVASGEVRADVEVGEQVLGLTFNADDTLLASAGTAGDGSGAVRLWDATTGRAMDLLDQGDLPGAQGVVFSPAGDLLVAGGLHEIRTWETATGELVDATTVHQAEIGPPPSWIFGFDSGQLLAAQAADRTVRRWMRGGFADPAVTIDERDDPIRALATASGPDDDLIAVAEAGTGGTVTVWPAGETSGPRRQLSTATGLVSVAISRDGEWTVAGDLDGGIWTSHASASTEPARIAHVGVPVYGLAAAPDGTVYAGGGGEVLVLDPATGNAIGPAVEMRASRGPVREFLGLEPVTTTEAITDVAISADGELIGVSSISGKVFLGDLDDEDPLEPIGQHLGAANAVAFSPDATLLASAGSGGRVLFLDTRTRELVSMRVQQDEAIESVAFSPDGRLLVTGDSAGEIVSWRLDTGRRIGEPFTGHSGPITGVAFSSDGTRVYSTSRDGTLRVWDLLDPRRACELAAPFVTHERLSNALGPDREPSVCDLGY